MRKSCGSHTILPQQKMESFNIIIRIIGKSSDVTTTNATYRGLGGIRFVVPSCSTRVGPAGYRGARTAVRRAT